jgi:EmrB/QacA subfamily drug resistance transporter
MDRKWWTLVVVGAGTFMLLLDVTIVVVALPDIQRALDASLSDVQWVVDAYALTLASLLLTTGVLADRYGRRLLFAIGITIFTVGSLTCGLAQSPLMLIVSRSVQGVGGAIMFATSLALLGHSFRGKDRGVAFAVWGAITGVAVSLGPILGGVITSEISWRGIFLVNVPVGVAALWATLARVDESRAPDPGRPDWIGFVLLTAGLVTLIYGLIRASETHWGEGLVVACLVGATVLLAGFVVAEWLVPEPMFDLSLFRVPTFTGGLIAAFTMNGSLFAMFLYLVLYLQDALGYSALQTGLRLLVSTGALFVAAVVSGRLSEHVPIRLLIGPGLVLVGVGLVLMTGLTGTSDWTHLLPGLVVSGFGAGLVNPPLASTAIGVVEPERAGMASGVNSTFRQIGFATAIAALGSIFAAHVRTNLDHALASVPALASRAASDAAAIRHGDVAGALAATPPALRPRLAAAFQSAFASAVNELALISGVVALVGAVLAFALIRSKDFVGRGQDAGPAGADADAAPSAEGTREPRPAVATADRPRDGSGTPP